MKTIKQHILERLVINKHSNRGEITFDMLFDALSHMNRVTLMLTDIWSLRELPTIPHDINIKRTDAEGGEQIKAISALGILGKDDPTIVLNIYSTKEGNSIIYIENDDELYQVFSESQLQQILREALINKK